MGSLVYAVVASDWSGFVKAIIIAIVSAIVTGVFSFLTAVFIVRYNKPIHDKISAVAGKVGADRRYDDSNTSEEET